MSKVYVVQVGGKIPVTHVEIQKAENLDIAIQLALDGFDKQYPDATAIEILDVEQQKRGDDD